MTDRERALADLVLRSVEAMAVPASALEATTLADVLRLPVVIVTRPPPSKLLDAGFVPYDCHRNCGDQAANDPTSQSKHMVGWLLSGDDLILHSVVKIEARWLCLTPQLVPAAEQFRFIPDPCLEWRDEADGTRTACRHGREVPTALRKHPQQHIRMRDQFVALVQSGVPALEARDTVAKANGRSLDDL